jgi:hypothetical protein
MKLLLTTLLMTTALITGCSKTEDASKPGGGAPAGTVAPAEAASEVKPTVLAPKPPPPAGGGQSAPELSAEDLVRVKAMLEKQRADAKQLSVGASAPLNK